MDLRSVPSRVAHGGIWGACMVIISLFLGGAGHGVFAPLGVFAAPFSLFGVYAAWLACIPIGALFSFASVHKYFRWIALAHYI